MNNPFKQSFLKALDPPPIITVSEWADNNRMLPSKTSSEPGRWRTDRTPYLRQVMDELSHMSETKEVVFKKGSQIGATEALNNFLGYIIDYMPSTAMVVWPALPDVKKNSSLRIDPLLESTPSLAGKVWDRKENSKAKKKNTAMFKDFDGGALVLTGANSASGLRSVPAKYLLLDEIDGYPDDVEGEGDPIKLTEARSRTFSRRKVFKISTPTIKGRSKIAREFKLSDQRYYNVPCPHCGEKQKLEFENLSYETVKNQDGLKVVSALYHCCHCGEGIEEFHKTKMLMAGEWIKENPISDVAGFHLSSLYSPLGWMSWVEIAQDWMDAQGNFELLMTFYNTVLGLEYEDTGDKPEHEKLFARREQYDIGTCPMGVLFLTCAVDVQKDRLEAEVIGWGRKKERWSIDHNVIMGSPQDKETWDDLELYITRLFPHDSGQQIPIRLVGIDSGYETSYVYSFCRKFSPKRVIPLKGEQALPQVVGTPRAVDVRENGKTLRRGLKLWRVGTNVIKSELYGDLQKDEPDDITEDYPPGFIHFPQYEMEYFLQLTAEERVVKKDNRGYKKIIWEKRRDRNEILDLNVYNRALASIIGIDKMDENGYNALEKKLKVVSKIEKKDNTKRIRKKRERKESSWLRR